MTTHINRQRATNRTRIAQALFGVLVVGGGAAMAVGLRPGSRVQVPPSGKPAIPENTDLGQKSGSAKNHTLDASGLAERLNLVSNAPKPLEVAAAAGAAGPDKGGSVQPPPPPAELRYLGGVISGRNMALVSDNGKQRFVTIGDALAGGTVESISETTVKIGGGSPRTLELADRGADSVTKGRTPQRGGTGLTLQKPGSLAVVKQPSPQGVSLGAANGGGINGQEIPPMPDYIRPDQSRRYEELRSEVRRQKTLGSEAEIAEYAAKLLGSEDPKSVDQGLMDKEHNARSGGGGPSSFGPAKGGAKN